MHFSSDCAFSGCIGLFSVYYAGTEEEWAEIEISGGNDLLSAATRYYDSAAKPTEGGNDWHDVDGVPPVR